jgi:hypothetical protein
MATHGETFPKLRWLSRSHPLSLYHTFRILEDMNLKFKATTDPDGPHLPEIPGQTCGTAWVVEQKMQANVNSLVDNWKPGLGKFPGPSLSLSCCILCCPWIWWRLNNLETLNFFCASQWFPVFVPSPGPRARSSANCSPVSGHRRWPFDSAATRKSFPIHWVPYHPSYIDAVRGLRWDSEWFWFPCSSQWTDSREHPQEGLLMCFNLQIYGFSNPGGRHVPWQLSRYL